MLKYLRRILLGEPGYTMPVFWYKYQSNPFSGPQYFHVRAINQEEANKVAMKKFADLFASGQTTMSVFYPTSKPPKAG